MAAIAAALAVIVVGLWLWFGQGDRNTATGTARVEAVNPVPAPPAVELRPEPPPTPPIAPPAVAPLVGTIPVADSVLLDVATYPNEAQATDVVKELATRGLPVFSRFDARGKVHSVMVGPYVSRDEALEAQKQVEALKYAKTRIIVEPAPR